MVNCNNGTLELTVYGVHDHTDEKHKAGLSTEHRNILKPYMTGTLLKPKQVQIILQKADNLDQLGKNSKRVVIPHCTHRITNST
jgi:hypothetical protein